MKLPAHLQYLIGALACLVAALIATPVSAQRFGISGSISYNGALGPVTNRRPLCLCVFLDPGLTDSLGCLIRGSNNSSYQITASGAATYYLIAFLDIDLNERVDANEPYEIYLNHTAPPADGVATSPAQKDINFVFGDESLDPDPTLTPTATDTPTETSTETPTASPSVTATSEATATATVPVCDGDCDGSATVTIDEVITLVNVALGDRAVADCPRGDADHSGGIEVADIVTAIFGALNGCASGQ